MTNVIQIADKADMPRIFSVDGDGNSQAPEQLHPAQINHADFGDNSALKRASDCLKFAWEGLASIDNVRANPDPEDKPATHARKVRQNIDGFDHVRAERWDGAKAGVIAEQRRIEGELEREANLKPIPHHFDAITSTFHNMKPNERVNALNELIEQGDGPALATLLEAPAFLTGLTAEQRDGIRLRLFGKVNPQGLALRNQLAKALTKMEAGSLAAINASMALRNGTDRFDKRAKEAEELANKARTGFSA